MFDFKQWWKLHFHDCENHLTIRRKYVYNLDGIDNAVSIYGPLGSYWIEIERCKVCGKFIGCRKYNTYGAIRLGIAAAKTWWDATEKQERHLGEMGNYVE